MNIWIKMLQEISLSKSEKEVALRFEKDPDGKAFMPVAGILKDKGYVNESIELLSQGVHRHSELIVARVVLARELLDRGMVYDSWNILDSSPKRLRDNILAQKLKFQLALLLEKEDVTDETSKLLRMHNVLEGELKRLATILEQKGIKSAKEQLVKSFSDKGITLLLDNTETVTKNIVDNYEEEYHAVDAKVSEYFDFRKVATDNRLKAFYVVKLAEVIELDDTERNLNPSGSVELDSTTLAEIYAKQGHYFKSLAVYRRLLRLNNGNDFLRNKVSELVKLCEEQKVEDLTVDPEIVDQMENLELIDRQIKFYSDVLTQLEAR